jgi:hypothetical protein
MLARACLHAMTLSDATAAQRMPCEEIMPCRNSSQSEEIAAQLWPHMDQDKGNPSYMSRLPS